MDMRLKAAVCAALLSSNFAFADGTITDGSASLTYTTPVDIDDPNVDVNVGGADHIYQIGFLYRVAGDTREFYLGATSAESYVGNVATLTWANVDGRNLLDIEATITITDVGGGNAELQVSAEVSNISGGAVTADFFLYIDPDLDGNGLNDSAVLVGPGQVEVTNSSVWNFSAPSSDAYQVTEFADLALSLDDAALTNLNNSGLPFGPGDVTMAFQWSSQAIAAAGSAVFPATLGTLAGPIAPPAAPPVPGVTGPSTIGIPTLPGVFLGLLPLLLGGLGMRQLRGSKHTEN